MKTMCPPGYHQNGLMAVHSFGHVNTSSEQSDKMLKYDILNVFNFQQRLVFAHGSNHI